MFAEQSVYVNKLYDFGFAGIIGTQKKIPQICQQSRLWRHAYCLNAHAMKHVKNILCWNVARWTLSVGASTKAGHCRIHHGYSHLQGKQRGHSARPSRLCLLLNPGTRILVLLEGSVLRRAPCQSCGHVLQLFLRTAGFAATDEWAKKIPQFGVVILSVSFNHQHHIIMALVLRAAYYKRGTEHLICFWCICFFGFYWITLLFNRRDSLPRHSERIFFLLNIYHKSTLVKEKFFK